MMRSAPGSMSELGVEERDDEADEKEDEEDEEEVERVERGEEEMGGEVGERTGEGARRGAVGEELLGFLRAERTATEEVEAATVKGDTFGISVEEGIHVVSFEPGERTGGGRTARARGKAPVEEPMR